MVPVDIIDDPRCTVVVSMSAVDLIRATSTEPSTGLILSRGEGPDRFDTEDGPVVRQVRR
jgi:hypothetical protein